MVTDPQVLDDITFLLHTVETMQRNMLKLIETVTGLTEVVARQQLAIQHLQAGYDGVPEKGGLHDVRLSH